MNVSVDRKIAAMARKQRGYVKRRQLMQMGLSDKAIRYRIRVGRLIPVYAGVYAVGHLPRLPQDQAFAALLACGPNAVLSHGTAAAAWGIFTHWQTPFEVTVPSIRRRQGIQVHRAALERRDWTTQMGLRVTSPARTMLDVAPRLSDVRLRRAVNDLRRPGRLHLDQLSDVLDRFPRHPSSRRLRPLLDAPGGGPTRSELEDRFLAFAKRFRLPQFETNVRVAGREADIWFPEERVIVELDGWDFHSDRANYEGDRDNDATALALDIPTVRVTDQRMAEAPEREAARLLRILELRRAA